MSLMWGSDSTAYDPAQARELPYASLDAKLGKTASVLLILGEIDSQKNLHWFSADRAQIVTENLRVIKTAGLPKNLSQTIWLTPPPDAPANQRVGHESIREVDLQEDNMFGVVIKSKTVEISDEEINIYGKLIKTQKTTEYNKSPSTGWEFYNHFWRDTDGYTWMAEQHISPSIPILKLKVLKPYQK